ncbi:MAG: beta-glucosidase family protein, partial [Planctomycetota bacterium]
ILGPGFNIVRTPLCGRNFEYYSEDPFLVCALVKDAVEGIQEQGTAACAKHFACNSQEQNRRDVDAIVSERALREIYLPGFKAAVDAGVLTIMGAYNKLRGQWCCQNDTLLNGILKKEWGFAGATISDWNGVRCNTYEPAYGGMDIEMGTSRPYDEYFLSGPLKAAVERGEIDEELVNDKVRRILYVMHAIGAMGRGKASRPAGQRNTTEHQQQARTIAEEAVVLLKNDGATLPFSDRIKTLLVVGDQAVATHHAGGGSSGVKALYEVTPLEGIEARLGDGVKVEHVPDPAPPEGEAIPTDILSPADLGAGVNGWKVQTFVGRILTPDMTPAAQGAINEMTFSWAESLPEGVDSQSNWVTNFTTVLTPPESGTYTFIVHGTRDAALFMNDQIVIRRDKVEVGTVDSSVAVDLVAGQPVELMLQVLPHETASGKRVSLRWLPPGSAQAPSLDELAAKAEAADAVVYVGGLSHHDDTEGKDKYSLEFPGSQNAVIARLAEANPRFAVLMVSGSPYTMPWIERVPAVVQLWYAGMEAGHVAAGVLFGDVNPSGKLPVTFPKQLTDSPAHALDDYHDDACFYKEDIFVGYRWFDARGIEPLFPFGHGLSYTTFDYSDLQIQTGSDPLVRVSFTLTNTGDVAGAEVAQLYLHDCDCSVRRPPQELKGFRKVHLGPGEQATVSLDLGIEELSFFHPTKREWTAEPGEFEIRINSSSRDNRLKGSFTFGG